MVVISGKEASACVLIFFLGFLLFLFLSIAAFERLFSPARQSSCSSISFWFLSCTRAFTFCKVFDSQHHLPARTPGEPTSGRPSSWTRLVYSRADVQKAWVCAWVVCLVSPVQLFILVILWVPPFLPGHCGHGNDTVWMASRSISALVSTDYRPRRLQRVTAATGYMDICQLWEQRACERAATASATTGNESICFATRGG